jgi:hypothetical protein
MSTFLALKCPLFSALLSTQSAQVSSTEGVNICMKSGTRYIINNNLKCKFKFKLFYWK